MCPGYGVCVSSTACKPTTWNVCVVCAEVWLPMPQNLIPISHSNISALPCVLRNLVPDESFEDEIRVIIRHTAAAFLQRARKVTRQEMAGYFTVFRLCILVSSLPSSPPFPSSPPSPPSLPPFPPSPPPPPSPLLLSSLPLRWTFRHSSQTKCSRQLLHTCTCTCWPGENVRLSQDTGILCTSNHLVCVPPTQYPGVRMWRLLRRLCSWSMAATPTWP